jgi:hypothetical protein
MGGWPSFDYESVKIMPHYICLKIVMRYLFAPLQAALYNLDKNVCFLDIDDKYANIKLSCDWCSICNGIIETAMQNIQENPELLGSIDFGGLQVFDRYLDFILVNRTTKITNLEAERWCVNRFWRRTDEHILLSKIYLKFEMIELRWCPFKRSKEFYYRNRDARYLEPTDQMIYELGKILAEYETITCNNCPKIINEKWKYTKRQSESIFQPLLDYMMREITTRK